MSDLAVTPSPRLRRALRRVYMGQWDGVPWAEWLVRLFPGHFLLGGRAEFAPYHQQLWEWVSSIEPGVRPEPFVAIWPRFAGKSTNAEAACVYLGAQGVRKYGLYVCGTQAQADDHVQNVAGMLENQGMAREYPDMGERAVGKYGQSKGWRIKRLRTASGFTLDAIGLDKAIRGAKIEEQRPDFIVFDDIDDQGDTPRTVAKKEAAIQRKILPAGAEDCAILATQNLIHNGSCFARLADGRADYLKRRRISGPFPALEGMAFREEAGKTVVTGGRPTWAGFSLPRCQGLIDDIGLTAFLVECQHETQVAAGLFLAGIWHPSVHVVRPFVVPAGWRVDRSFDWGSSKPWCCIWWAEADGEAAIPEHGGRRYPKGTLFALAEYYGWNGKPNEGNRDDSVQMARKILAAQQASLWGGRTQKGPADSSIYDVEDGDSIGDRMARAGVVWVDAEKGPGTRKAGADAIAERLRAALRSPMDSPGLFVVEGCRQIIRTFPELQRDMLKDGDVDSDGEDHLWDATRYRLLTRRWAVSTAKVTGV